MSQVTHESTEDGAVLLQRGQSSWLRWKRYSSQPVGSVEGVLTYRTRIPPTRLFTSRSEMLTIMRDRRKMLRVRDMINEGVSRWEEEQAARRTKDLVQEVERIPMEEMLRRLFRNSGLTTPPDSAHD